MGRPYYARIAKAWHDATGSTGGPLKKYVLNDLLLDAIGDIGGRAILELGAGNGYFARLLARRRSGQVPSRLVISDVSGAMLDLAQRVLPVAQAEYRQLDVRRRFPFEGGSFDLIVASMVFNELSSGGLRRCLTECARVLVDDGRLFATITHPDFVTRLRSNGKLSKLGPEFWTMPGKGSMRLPVVPRSLGEYERLLVAAGFECDTNDVLPPQEVLRERPGLRHASGLPIALVFRCMLSSRGVE